MNADTQRFEAVTVYPTVESGYARTSTYADGSHTGSSYVGGTYSEGTHEGGRLIDKRGAIIIAVVLLLTVAAVLGFGLFLNGGGEVAAETTPALVAPEPAPEPANETPETAQAPAPEPTEAPEAPAAPPADDGDDEPAAEPVDPPEPEPTEPEVFAHPLDGTLWDVVVLSDGVGGMYDIHPSFPHQVEFDEGRVISRGFVNTSSGDYAITGNEYGWGSGFSVDTMMTTLMGGPADAMTQEAWINSAIQSATSYDIDGYTLTFTDGASTLLILEIVPGC